MNEKTRYQYEKRIKELEQRIRDLEEYKALATTVFDTVVQLTGECKQVSHAWIIKQFRAVFK